MTRNRLFQLLDTLSTNEWTLIKKSILASNKEDSQKAELISLLFRHRKGDSLKKFNASYIHSHSFTHLSTKSFQNLLSALQKDILNILTHEQLANEIEIFNSAQLYVLRQKGLYEWHDSLLSKSEEVIYTQSVSRYSNFHIFKNALDTYLSNHPIKEKNGEILIEKILKFQEKFNSDFNVLIKLITSFREEIFREVWTKVPSINIDTLTTEFQVALYNLTEIRNGTNTELVGLVEEFMFKNNLLLSKDMKTLFAFGLIQHYRSRMPVTEAIAQNLLKLYKYMDQEDILIVSNKIHSVVFLNVINTAMSVYNNDWDWAEAFYNKYKNMINDNYPEEVQKVGQGIIELGKKNYSNVLQILRTAFPKGITSKVLTYGLEIRAMYKLGNNDEALNSKIRNLNEWLKRHEGEISERVKKGLTDLGQSINMLRKEYSQKLLEDLKLNRLEPFHKAWIIFEIKNMG